MKKVRTLLAIAGLGLLVLAPAEAKKVKTPKSDNANVQRSTKKGKKYKASKYKNPKLSKKPGKSAGMKYGSKQKS